MTKGVKLPNGVGRHYSRCRTEGEQMDDEGLLYRLSGRSWWGARKLRDRLKT